jgi:hypothetical protein
MYYNFIENFSDFLEIGILTITFAILEHAHKRYTF